MQQNARSFFREHPTMLLTFCYFIITVIGVLYSYFFYQEFGINIIKFADLSDFLLASILEPLSIIIFVGIVIFYLLNFWFDIWCRKRFKWYGEFAEKRLKSKYSDPILFISAIIILTTAVVNILAVNNAKNIKSGIVDEFSVRLSDPGEHIQELPLALLGSSSRYAYFYDVSKSETIVIPVENFSFMRKKIKPVVSDEEKLKAVENSIIEEKSDVEGKNKP